MFAVFFAWFVAFPASIIILDFDLAIIPERLVYSPGYQRAWTFNPTNPTVIADLIQLSASAKQSCGFTLRSSSLQLDQNSKLDMFKSIVKVINNVERRNKNIRRMKNNKPTNRIE